MDYRTTEKILDMERNLQEKFSEWNNKKPIMLNITRIIEYIKKYKKEKNDKYIWVYDDSIVKCNCKADYNSPPYCIHYNKLTRKKIHV